MPVGQGHTNFTRYATNRGVNPITILAPAHGRGHRPLAWSATRVKIAQGRRARDRDSLILFGGSTRERPDWTHGGGRTLMISDRISDSDLVQMETYDFTITTINPQSEI